LIIYNFTQMKSFDRAKRRPSTAAILRKHGGKTSKELKAEGK